MAARVVVLGLVQVRDARVAVLGNFVGQFLGQGVTKLVWEPYKLARAIQQSSYTKCLARNPEIQASGLLAAADATRRRREILNSRAMGYWRLLMLPGATDATRRPPEILKLRATGGC